MDDYKLYEFLKDHLSITLEDDSEPDSCGGEVAGILGVRAILQIRNPQTKQIEEIAVARCTLNL